MNDQTNSNNDFPEAEEINFVHDQTNAPDVNTEDIAKDAK